MVDFYFQSHRKAIRRQRGRLRWCRIIVNWFWAILCVANTTWKPVKAWLEIEKRPDGRNVLRCRKVKRFLCHSERRKMVYFELFNQELRILVGLLAGHLPLCYHFFQNGYCKCQRLRLCYLEDETVKHILRLREWEAIADIRIRHLRKAYLWHTDVVKGPPCL